MLRKARLVLSASGCFIPSKSVNKFYCDMQRKCMVLNNSLRFSSLGAFSTQAETSSFSLDQSAADSQTDASARSKEIASITNEQLFRKYVQVNSKMSVNDASSLLHRLWLLNKSGEISDSKQLVNEEANAGLLLTLKEACHRLSHLTLISALDYCLQLGVGSRHATVETMENEILWRVKKLNPIALLRLVYIQTNFKETKIQEKVLSESISVLRSKKEEIQKPSEILRALLAPEGKIPLEVRSFLEERCVDLSDLLTQDECVKLIRNLAQLKRRNMTLLKCLSARLESIEEDLPLNKAVDIGYAFASLSFHKEGGMLKIMKSLLNRRRGNALNVKTVCNFFTIFGQLRYRDDVVLNILYNELLRNDAQTFALSDYAAFVLTYSRLNYSCEEFDDMFDKAGDFFVKNISEFKPKQLLDCVAALADLGKARKELLAAVLDKGISYFMGKETVPAKIHAIRCKFANIAAYAALEHGISCSKDCFLSKAEELVIPRGREKLVDLIRRSLNSYAPKNKYLSYESGFELGYYTACEILVNEIGQPLPLKVNKLVKIEPGAAIVGDEENCYRVMLFGWDYNDVTWPNSKLIGPNARCVENYRKLGYVPVEISYRDFSVLSTEVSRIQHLKHKIEEAVKEIHRLGTASKQ